MLVLLAVVKEQQEVDHRGCEVLQWGRLNRMG